MRKEDGGIGLNFPAYRREGDTVLSFKRDSNTPAIFLKSNIKKITSKADSGFGFLF